MTFSRRRFLKTTTGSLAAGLLASWKIYLSNSWRELVACNLGIRLLDVSPQWKPQVFASKFSALRFLS